MRSWLFVPGDSPRKIEKALGSGADVLILDLEDSVAVDEKDQARAITCAALADADRDQSPALFVRINALESGLSETDLAAIMPGRPDGIMVPKTGSGADVTAVDVMLRVAEAEAGIADGSTQIAVVATETAAALFTLGTYAGASPRLAMLTWGAEDLAAELGAETNRDESGTYTDPYRLARSLALAGATAAGVAPIDTVFTGFRDTDGLRAEAEAARRDGFVGKMAIHPAQVPVINAVFTPSADAIAHAQAVVDAFAATPGAGVVSLGGRMVDRPHLRQAERILDRARQGEDRSA